MTPSPSSQRMRLLGMGVLIATFMTGGLAGAAVHQAVSAENGVRLEPRTVRPAQRHEFPYRELDLTPPQQGAVDDVLDRRKEQLDSIWTACGPRTEAVVDSARTEIRALLTPAQRMEMDSMRARFRRARLQEENDAAGTEQTEREQ